VRVVETARRLDEQMDLFYLIEATALRQSRNELRAALAIVAPEGSKE
jgi:hypothetical protein